jgi:hypothetical protein
MPQVRRIVSTLLIGGACMAGLTACGGAEKVSDQSFIDACKDNVSKNATAKAYAADICKCAQDKLKAAGKGDATADDADTIKAANEQIAACTQEKVTGQ